MPQDNAPQHQKTNLDHELTRFFISLRRWWRYDVIVSIDQQGVIDRRRQECVLSARYVLMLTMSAGIAVLGLLQSSPAVVIGAMLLSPLMEPIMGLGFGLAIGDFKWTKQSLKTLLIGALAAVLFSALLVFFSPLQTVTSEIAARTRPNLLDLGIALFSAVAGAYAMIRGREGTIVGVAIATALMPPLSVVGFGLATFNWVVFNGALMLFVTNLVTIAGTAFLMAKLYGFRTSLTEKQTRLQFVLTLAAFVALAIPLGLSLRQIAWEASAQRIIRDEVVRSFDERARVAQLDISWDTEPLEIAAIVLTPQLNPKAEAETQTGLERTLKQPLTYSLTQYQVGTSSDAADAAQVAAARVKEEQASAARANELAGQLALVAGVSEENVVVDRQRRRAVVRAEPLPGAGMASYAVLEQRIAATEPEWKIELIPPLDPLPAIPVSEDKPDANTVALIAWAAARKGLPVSVSGPSEQVEQVVKALTEKGVSATAGPDRGTLRAEWNEAD